jgi:hypothetical protein
MLVELVVAAEFGNEQNATGHRWRASQLPEDILDIH